MAANYRYWCGECRHRTPWLTESQGADQHWTHYAQHHPGIPAGGRVEIRRSSGSGAGCLALIGLLFVLLLLAATCQHQPDVGSPGSPQVSTEQPR